MVTNDTGEHWHQSLAITERYTEQYFDLLKALGVTTITNHPQATAYIPQMIAYINRLIERGHAYPTQDGFIFRIQTQDEYGKLSGRRPEDMKARAHIDRHDGLEHPGDFCLWKLAKPGEPSWGKPLG